MLSMPDFSKKQMIFVMAKDGERLSFANENLIVTDKDGKTKLQCTCYRLFMVFVLGNCSITSVILQKAKKYGFYIVFASTGFHINNIVGAEKEGNTMLKRKQYCYDNNDIAKAIVRNKIHNQIQTLKKIRNKSEYLKKSIKTILEYQTKVDFVNDLYELLAYEGLSSKLYFKNLFYDVNWKGRQPRIKRDAINATLDIGYTILFNLIDALLGCFGFDTYCGILHKEFYMRKSLVCDLVEPFRPVVDVTVKKALNLKQIKEEDFIVVQGQYRLKWEKNSDYVKFLLTPLMERKEEIFVYVQQYYRSFMKGKTTNFPFFEV